MAIDFPATRWSMVARLEGGPQEAAPLLALYADAIGAYLRAKLADERPDRIEDVVQEVLLGLLHRPEAMARAAPGAGSRFRHWLMHIAWQAALNHLRHLRRRDLPALDPSIDAGQPPADDAVPVEQQGAMDRAWALSVLRQAMEDARTDASAGRLDPEALRVLTAHLIDGRALRDIAAATGLSLATCSRRLAEGRRHLQRSMADRLRLAGELAEGDAPEAAGARLIDLLAGA